MKYFTWELLERVSSLEPPIAAAAEPLWNQACRDAAKELDACRPYLSKNLHTLFCNGRFHDAYIDRLEIHPGRKGMDLLLHVIQEHGEERPFRGTFIHRNVTDFRCSSRFQCFFQWNCLGDYLYSEIRRENACIVHACLFGEDGEMEIHCQKLLWQPEK